MFLKLKIVIQRLRDAEEQARDDWCQTLPYLPCHGNAAHRQHQGRREVPHPAVWNSCRGVYRLPEGSSRGSGYLRQQSSEPPGRPACIGSRDDECRLEEPCDLCRDVPAQQGGEERLPAGGSSRYGSPDDRWSYRWYLADERW